MSDDPTPQPPDESEPTLAYPQSRPIPYGSSPYAVSLTPSTVPDTAVTQRRLIEPADIWTALLGTVGVILVGLLAGLVWWWLAPRAVGVTDGKGNSGLLNPESKAFAGADVTFLLVTLGAGMLCGVVAAILARRRGLAVSIAMAVGGTAASVLAAWIGRTLSGGPAKHWAAHLAAGNHHYFIDLVTRPFLVAWPIAALGVTFVVGLLTPDRPLEIEPTEPAPADPARQ